MDPFKPERAVYTPSDFVLWQEHGILVLTPKFQRRGVWTLAAKSFLMDTILRGMTIPPLYLRTTQNEEKTKSVREVVDGQQRVRSVLDFIKEDGYRLSRTLKAPWAGKRYADLSDEQQQQIMDFGFSAEVFRGISDQQVLEVFCRLNMNGVQLNKQELRNGKYFGYFKQAAFDLALEHLQFWRTNKIFSEQNIARMLEVELTSELLTVADAGMTDKKVIVEDYYKKFDEAYPMETTHSRRFRSVIATISDSFEGDLSDTAFRRQPLFYTLFCVVYHRMYGMEGVKRTTPKRKLKADERAALKEAAMKLTAAIAASKDPEEGTPRGYADFVSATSKQTDNLRQRRIRFEALYGEAFS